MIAFPVWLCWTLAGLLLFAPVIGAIAWRFAPHPKVDDPGCLERYVADDIARGSPGTAERYIDVWRERYVPNLFPDDLERHMRQRFPRTYIGGWLHQVMFRVAEHRRIRRWPLDGGPYTPERLNAARRHHQRKGRL